MSTTKQHEQVMLSELVPSLSVGPGFLSTSPAIRSRDSTTAHTRSSKHTLLPNRPTPAAVPLTPALGTDPLPNLGQRILPHPPLPFGQPPPFVERILQYQRQGDDRYATLEH